MGFVYSGGTYVDTTSSISTATALCDFIKNQAVIAGWTSALQKSTIKINYTGQPGNNNTFVVNGVTYTFKSAINNANFGEILIDATATDSYNNLMNAINGGAGSGTQYSSATTTNTDVSAVSNTGTVLTIQSLVGGTGKGYAVSETLANASFDNSGGKMYHGGYLLTSAETPAANGGMKYQVQVIHQGEQAAGTFGDGTMRIIVNNRDGAVPSSTGVNIVAGGGVPSLSDGFYMNANDSGAAVTFRFTGAKHWFACYWENVFTGNGTFIFAGTLSIPTFLQGPLVGNASNTTPIEITTTTNHGFTTGDQVWIVGVGGNTAANGNWSITVTGLASFTLDTSAGNGAWTSGGRVGKKDSSISDAFFLSAQGTGAGSKALFQNRSAATGQGYFSVNGNTLGQNGASTGGGIGEPQVVIAGGAREADNSDQPLIWYNGMFNISDVFLAWGPDVTGTNRKIVGQMYDAGWVHKKQTAQDSFSMDTHTWRIITVDDNTGSEFLGALAVRGV